MIPYYIHFMGVYHIPDYTNVCNLNPSKSVFQSPSFGI